MQKQSTPMEQTVRIESPCTPVETATRETKPGDSVYRKRDRSAGKRKHLSKRTRKFLQLCIAAAISLIVLGGALFVILSNNYDDATEKWAFGAVGIILGYWLNR